MGSGVGVASNASPTINFVTQATSFVNGKAQEGWDVFAFHNAVNDILKSGAVQGISMENIPQLLTLLPSDWQHTYTTDPNGLENLSRGLQELEDFARQVWTSGALSGGAKDSWFPGGTWQNYQNTYQQANQTSIQKNQGTEKNGLADHPDYTGAVGHTSEYNPFDNPGSKVIDKVLGSTAGEFVGAKNPQAAALLGGLSVIFANGQAMKDSGMQKLIFNNTETASSVSQRPTMSEIKSTFQNYEQKAESIFTKAAGTLKGWLGL
jgi:hypothetical protein